MTWRALIVAAVLSVMLAAHTSAQDTPPGGNRYRPGLDFRTLSIDHFEVHYHQGEEALAQRLAAIIQRVAPDLEARYGRPAGRVRVVLVDQSDVSNGWATVIPYNLIEIAAAPPTASSVIGNTDDWLRLVFTHEYTHVLHLEKSGGWFGSLRRVFGRVPAFYPNLFVPDWQIEGLATFEESALTGRGRVPAGDFRSMLEQAALERGLPPLDRATGAVIDWPGGNSAYLFGAYFHAYLAERYGADRLTRLADATARRLPFTGSRAYREIFGKSLGTLWQEFREESARVAAQAQSSDRRTRLTTHGFTTLSPAFTGDGRLVYGAATAHEFPSINEVRDGRVHRLATRFHGRRVSAAGDLLVFDQLQLAANVALVSDLYSYSLRDGQTRRLTDGARAADPDLSPDGRTIVCTVQRTGGRGLATLPIAGGDPVALIEEPDTDFSAPRWSPDGRAVAAERRRLGGPSEIVLVDVGTRAVRTLTSTSDGRHILPTWSPDGRLLFYSSDRGERQFTLHVLTVADGTVRRVAAAGPGAQAAVVAPNGERLVFVGYSADGFDLYSIPYDERAFEPVAVADVNAVPSPLASLGPNDTVQSRPYSPLGTLLPRFWIPYAETDGEDTILGAGTAGFDALGRHAYTATVGWAVPRNRADLQFDYTYSRWWPTLFVSAADDTDAWREGAIRTRELNAGVLLPWRQVRWNASLLVAGSTSRDDFERASPAFPVRPDRRRDALRLGWTTSTARGFGYSISAEEGASFNVITEFASGGPDGDRGEATSVVGSARGYFRAWPRHGVVATRIAMATSRGDAQARRDFSAGGSGPQGGGFAVGVDAIGLLRGYDEQDLFGRSAAVGNLDYRFPLGWPQRGLGTLPIFLRGVHGALFLDLGHAWDDRFDRDDVRRSLGAELSFDVVLGSFVPVTLATGVSWRDDPARVRTGAALFARIGRAF